MPRYRFRQSQLIIPCWCKRMPRCACGYEFIDYWTSDLIELEITGENLRALNVTRENPEQGTNKPTLVPVPSASRFSGEEGNGSAPTFAPFGVWTGGAPSARGGPDRCLSPPFSPTSWFCTRIQSLHGSPGGQTRRAIPIRRFLAGAEGQIDGGAWALGARSSELSPDPGSLVARRGRRGLGLQSAVSEIPRSTCSLVAFPGGKQTLVDTPRRA
ncbi:uncharacterized protein [Odocoileus virginianus]|uniref:Uncharacterized protein n=1 Tax=Odocoileus virginianus TaxID=9874 RepID=A0ABM4IJD2_ODOVR